MVAGVASPVLAGEFRGDGRPLQVRDASTGVSAACGPGLDRGDFMYFFFARGADMAGRVEIGLSGGKRG